MNRNQAKDTLRKVLAYCPAQSVDEYTPDAWAEALDDIRFEDAIEAVRRIGRREAEPGNSLFIEPRHIRSEVRKLRVERMNRHPQVEPPAELDPSDFMSWHRSIQRRIADGEIIEQKALPARKVDYSGIVKGVEDARLQLRAVPESARVPGPSDDDEPADQGGEVRGAEAYRRVESSPARARHRVDI